METKFNNDGTKMFALDSTNGVDKILEYTLSTAFDVSTASYDGADETFSIGSQHTSAYRFRI